MNCTLASLVALTLLTVTARALGNVGDTVIILEAIRRAETEGQIQASSRLSSARQLGADLAANSVPFDQAWERVKEDLPLDPNAVIMEVLFESYMQANEDTEAILARAKQIWGHAKDAASWFRNTLGVDALTAAEWLSGTWNTGANETAEALEYAGYEILECVDAVTTVQPTEVVKLLLGYVDTKLQTIDDAGVIGALAERIKGFLNPSSTVAATRTTLHEVANLLAKVSGYGWKRVARLLNDADFQPEQIVGWLESRAVRAGDALLVLIDSAGLSVAEAAELLLDAGYAPPDVAAAMVEEGRVAFHVALQILTQLLGSPAAAMAALQG